MSVDFLRRNVEASWDTFRAEGGRPQLLKPLRVLNERYGGVRLLALFDDDIASVVDVRSLTKPSCTKPVAEPLRVGWVVTPPAAGSGGHTTAFRMVSALSDSGHHCTLFLYDQWRGKIGLETAGRTSSRVTDAAQRAFAILALRDRSKP